MTPKSRTNYGLQRLAHQVPEFLNKYLEIEEIVKDAVSSYSFKKSVKAYFLLNFG